MTDETLQAQCRAALLAECPHGSDSYYVEVDDAAACLARAILAASTTDGGVWPAQVTAALAAVQAGTDEP